MRNIHRDEMEVSLLNVMRQHVPCLAAKLGNDSYIVLLNSIQLDECAGDGLGYVVKCRTESSSKVIWTRSSGE